MMRGCWRIDADNRNKKEKKNKLVMSFPHKRWKNIILNLIFFLVLIKLFELVLIDLIQGNIFIKLCHPNQVCEISMQLISLLYSILVLSSLKLNFYQI